MSIRRAVPDIRSERFPESRAFYVDLLGFTVAMDLGHTMTFASPKNPTAQVTLIRSDGSLVPQMTVEVGDVDATYAEAQRRGADVVYRITDEPWGVRRFFVRDPNGIVVNVISHTP
jgi:catechol 2,3-dioxygenase-like lactoylglutathione lyase family enzyme